MVNQDVVAKSIKTYAKPLQFATLWATQFSQDLQLFMHTNHNFNFYIAIRRAILGSYSVMKSEDLHVDQIIQTISTVNQVAGNWNHATHRLHKYRTFSIFILFCL